MVKYYKIKYLFWLFSISVFTVLTGCMEEAIDDNINKYNGASGTLFFSLNVSGTETVVTRSGDEKPITDVTIKEVDLLLFGPSNTDEYKVNILAYCQATQVKDNVYSVTDFPFNPKGNNEERNLLVVTNAREQLKKLLGEPYSLEKNTSLSSNLGVIRNELFDLLTEREAGFVTDLPNVPIKMSSEMLNFKDGIQEGANISPDGVAIPLIRMLSKITVKSTLPKEIFELEGATVCDVAQQGYILPVNPQVINDINRISYRGEQDEMVVGATEMETIPIYVYETNVRESTAPVKVIIKAKYKGESSYYRLDLIDKSALSLERNHEYIIQIHSVDALGTESYQAARDNPAEGVKFNITDNDNANTEVIGGHFFSIDYENIDIYADSLSSVLLARVRTNYLSSPGADLGSITTSGGMKLLSSPTFLIGQDYLDIIVDVPYSFSSGVVTIILGNYKKQVKVSKYRSLDMHLVDLQYQNIRQARIQSSSGGATSDWIGLSANSYYNPIQNNIFLAPEQLVVSNYRLYIYLNENMNRTSRESEVHLVNTEGLKRKLYITQEGYERYRLGYFGGTISSVSGISMFIRNLIVEAYEEEESKLNWSDKTISDSDKDILLSDDGKEATWVLANSYQSPAALYCLHKNVDKNFNGTIDRDELDWYLPTIKQGLGLALYELAVDNIRSAYWSSTVLSNNLDYAWSFYSSQNYGSDIIQDENGFGGFRINSGFRTKARYVRCVREM